MNGLLGDLDRLCARAIEVVATENLPDPAALRAEGLGYRARILTNFSPRGFGANHNAAFAECRTPYFCVANPDIRLEHDPFPALLESLARPGAGVAGPLVRRPDGSIEDSARRFPTALSLAKKLFRPPAGPDYPCDRGPLEVDWVGGMFMTFRSDAFRAVHGFDERYFLYYEDVDICRRLAAKGQATLFDPRAAVIHDARRASRRDFRLMGIHAASALRFLTRRI